jgi:hypothetical protein
MVMKSPLTIFLRCHLQIVKVINNYSIIQCEVWVRETNESAIATATFLSSQNAKNKEIKMGKES